MLYNKLLISKQLLTLSTKDSQNKKLFAVSSLAVLLAACKNTAPGTSTNDYQHVIANKYFGYGYDRWNSSTFNKDVETIVFYQFNQDASKGSYSYGATEANFLAFDATQRDISRSYIRDLEDTIGITFIEIDPNDISITPDILIQGNLLMDSNTAGYANTPNYFGDSGGLTVKLGGALSALQFNDVFLHELGHALGLKHPFTDRGPLTPLTDSSAIGRLTIMSYNSNSSTFLEWDILALTYLYGAQSSQTVTYSFENGIVTINGSSGDDEFAGSSIRDVIDAGDGNDIIYAGAGNDIVHGGLGNDVIDGGTGVNELYGDAGNDTLIYAQYLTGHLYDGGEGVDVIDATNAEYGAYINFLDVSDRIISVENIIGSKHGDTLIGDEFNNIIDGSEGDDRLSGRGGEDTLIGGDGQDTAVIYSDNLSFSIDKDNGKINIIFDEGGNLSNDALASIEFIEQIDATTTIIDIKTIWSQLSAIDQATFNDNSADFNTWLNDSYGYETIA